VIRYFFPRDHYPLFLPRCCESECHPPVRAPFPPAGPSSEWQNASFQLFVTKKSSPLPSRTPALFRPRATLLSVRSPCYFPYTPSPQFLHYNVLYPRWPLNFPTSLLFLTPLVAKFLSPTTFSLTSPRSLTVCERTIPLDLSSANMFRLRFPTDRAFGARRVSTPPPNFYPFPHFIIFRLPIEVVLVPAFSLDPPPNYPICLRHDLLPFFFPLSELFSNWLSSCYPTQHGLHF